MMADRERVIKDWESILSRDPLDVPWDLINDTLTLLKEQEDLGTELMNAVELIHKKNERIEKLLKEQEAVEPILKRKAQNKKYNDYVCPRCYSEVVYEQNFCSECGVQFMWEGR